MLLPVAAEAFGLSPQDTSFLLDEFDPALQKSLTGVLQENGAFLSFPYVCPEPVLVK